MQCKKHFSGIIFICTKLNCNRGNLICQNCVQSDQQHRVEHRNYLLPFKDFIESQNGKTKQNFIPIVNDLLLELDKRLFEYNKQLEKENGEIEQDIAQFFKLFFEISENTKTVMREALYKDYKTKIQNVLQMKQQVKDIMDSKPISKKENSFFSQFTSKDGEKELPLNDDSIQQILQRNNMLNQIRSESLSLITKIQQSIQNSPTQGTNRPRYKNCVSTSQQQFEAIKQDFTNQLNFIYKQVINLLNDGTQSVEELKKSVYKSPTDIKGSILKLNDQIIINSNSTSRIIDTKQSQIFNSYNQPFIQLSQFPDISHHIKEVLKQLGPLPQPISDSLLLNLDRVGPIQFTSDNIIYEGQILNNQRHGWGVGLINGCFYEGYWRAGQSFGFGRLINQNGSVYEGMSLNGKAHGKGIYKSGDGQYYYEGDWQNDIKIGKGIEKVKGQYEFEGDFNDGIKSGSGKLIYYDTGDIYDGEFKNGLLDGQCTVQYSNGDKYWGELHYIDSQIKRQGRGIYVWADGRKYEGQYNLDQEDGKGLFLWKDGWMYNGEWQHGVQHGQGIQISPNGKEKTGIWNRGNFQQWI